MKFNSVNPFGIILMLAALAIVILAKKLTFGKLSVNAVKLIGTGICMAGALIAILC